MDGDAGLEEHDLVALDGEAGAEGVFLAAQHVDGAARRLGQRVGRPVVRLEHVLGLLVVADVVGPARQVVRQVQGGEVLVRVEDLADRLAHQPRLGFDLGQPPRVLEDAVQLRRRQPGLEVQPVRALHRVVARREQLLAQDRQHRHQRRLDGPQLVRQRRHVGRLVEPGQALLEVVVERRARCRTRRAPCALPHRIHQQRLVGLDDHAQVEELQQHRLGPHQDPRDPLGPQVDVPEVAVPQVELLGDLRLGQFLVARRQRAVVVEQRARDLAVVGAVFARLRRVQRRVLQEAFSLLVRV